jgi:hypothetical protein
VDVMSPTLTWSIPACYILTGSNSASPDPGGSTSRDQS